MTPPAFDGDVVAVRLRLLRDTLTQLEALRGFDAYVRQVATFLTSREAEGTV